MLFYKKANTPYEFNKDNGWDGQFLAQFIGNQEEYVHASAKEPDSNFFRASSCPR